MHLLRFDAIKADAVDSVGLFLNELDNFYTPCAPNVQSGPCSKQITQKGGVRPQEVTKRLRNLFLVVAENLLQHCY